MRCADILLLTSMALLAGGCASTKPCPPPPEAPPPTIIHEEVYRCPDLGQLPPVVLPVAPPFPAEFEEQSAWCVDVRDVATAREKILWEAIQARDRLIELMLTPADQPPGG